MGTNAIRLGLIGTGLATERLHWPAIRRLGDAFDVVAFTNRSQNKSEHFSHYSGYPMDRFIERYEDLLRRDDIEAVLISLPIPMNLPVAKAALEAGKHVICEKPAGSNLAEGRAFMELEAAHPDKVVLITENSFYRDDGRWARHLLDEGVIGRVHAASWRMVSHLIPREGSFSITPWRHDPGYEGGPHLDAGVHHTATIRLLLGDVTRVFGLTQDANTTHGGPSDLVLGMQFASGAIGHYTALWPEIEVRHEDNDFRLYGTDGVMIIRHRDVIVQKPGAPDMVYTTRQEDYGHYNSFVNFRDALRHDAPVVSTVTQTYRNMEMVLEGIASATDGQVRQMPYRPEELRAPALPLWRPLGPDPLFDDPAYVTTRVVEAT